MNSTTAFAEAMPPPEPALVVDLAPHVVAEPEFRTPKRQTGFTVINFNTAVQSLRCVASLAACEAPPAWILVLDNASREEDYELLRRSLAGASASRIRLYRSDVNLGFAAGSNFLMNELLRIPDCAYFGLLNNDAVAMPCLTTALSDALDGGDGMVGMSGGRMHRLAQPQQVDTLGIALYASLMPADRKDTSDPYLGPTGGCCLMTREFLEDLISVTGYCFDERFFCYCEDTDLVLRANLLGYRPAYVDVLVALHEGQASTGGGHNDFIAYHGLRNAMWMQCKLIPTALLWRYGHMLLLAHLMTIGRQILSGRSALLWRVYRDALARMGEFRRERQRIAASRRVDATGLRQAMSARFYRRGYAAVVLAEWKMRWRRAARVDDAA